jgi:hypothetical protein
LRRDCTPRRTRGHSREGPPRPLADSPVQLPLCRILSSRGISLAQYLVLDSIEVVAQELEELLHEEQDYYYSLDDRAEEQYREAYRAGTHPFYRNTAGLDLLIREIVIVADQ